MITISFFVCFRFWKCKVFKETDENGVKHIVNYHWEEWEMLRKDKESMIEIQGTFIAQ